MPFALLSTDFVHEASLPKEVTCQGANVSPDLHWTEGPPGTQSFVLIVDDPDAPDPRAPKTTWVHWVLYNLPPQARHLPKGAVKLPDGTLEGKNDWKKTGYGGPCPPIGRHRYFHKLYALDKVLPNLHLPTKAEVENAMKGHILAKTELMGTYEKASTTQR